MTGTDGAEAALTVRRITLPDAVVVTAAGELDLATAPALRRHALAALDRRPPALIVDLDGIRFCGSAGLQVLAELVSATGGAGLPFAVVTGRPAVLRTIRLTRLDAALSLHPTVDRARTWFRDRPDR
ncbi:STAS domain-containing protein [Amycolatopsis australiensis]|uniref:Anti-sigma factor antagonist n=1 Tax=Amycolatopsis australiensis TaxID=546364 RepID=A0A1K1R6K7_9PSEU|nr:STAS domain-containing protein [Amycolatopsis australiensis]SFW67553.1 anti-anti-sigma factor [Amycolatopsis australiensis]